MQRGARLDLPLTELERLIVEQKRQVRQLERVRAQYQRKLEKIDRSIESLRGSSRGRGRGGGRSGLPLPDAIARVLRRAGSALSVGDIMNKVLAGGYHTSSANFRSIVNIALIKDRRFKSAGRGVYRLSAAGGAARQKRSRKKTRARGFAA